MAKGKSLTSGQQLRQQRHNKRENIEQNLGLKPIDVAAEIRRLELSLKKLHQELLQYYKFFVINFVDLNQIIIFQFLSIYHQVQVKSYTPK